MPDHCSRSLEELGRLAAEIGNGTRKPLLEFRDETERWAFRMEMACVDIRADLWKMTAQLKVLAKFLDRR